MGSVALVAAVLAAVCVLAVRRFFGALSRRAALAASTLLCGLVIAAPLALLGVAQIEDSSGDVHPRLVDYATSDACLECHPGNHASWHRTYHRTMTRDADPESVLGDFDGEERRAKGLPARLFRRGDRFFMSLVDPTWEANERASARDPRAASDPPRIEWSVDRVVGSHNMQVYLSRLDDGRYVQLPLEWHVASGRWLAQSGLLTPESSQLYQDMRGNLPWNLTCIFCHNTGPNPGLVGEGRALRLESTVAELGIACEACHGPAERHVAANRNPLRRLWTRAVDRGDATIVNPARLAKQDSVESCGRCHGKWGVVGRAIKVQYRQGDLFRPGPFGLEAYYEHGPTAGNPHREESDGSWYWPDGTPRPTSMEYQGVISSPCYLEGELTCLSCHSMHAADRDAQLRFTDAAAPRRASDELCTQCHAQYTGLAEIAAHTRHRPESAGSRCVSCHMPYLTWGLMKPIRTHRISSPDAGASVANAMPNACNQCHVDRSLGWTADALARGYGQDRPALPSHAENLSATIVDLVQGHAVRRVLAAARLGAADAHEAAPGAWRAPFLIEALDDRYMVVRYAAEKALRSLPGFESLEADFLAAAPERRHAVRSARAAWKQNGPPAPAPAAVPLAGKHFTRDVAALRAQRFDPPITLVE